jgi:hypothetical protein
MNYQQPGNFLQDQGYFQINTSVKELLTSPIFKLFLSGQYLLELVDVSVDSQFFALATNNKSCEIFRLNSPQFSSTMSETTGITFCPPLNEFSIGISQGNASVRYAGSVRPSLNKILATLNGSIQLILDIFSIENTAGADASYKPLSAIVNNTANTNMVFSFGFQYSKVK